MNSSVDTKDVLAALHAAWGKLAYIQKDASGQGYKYVSDLALTSKVHPVFVECGLMLIPVDTRAEYTKIQETRGGAHQYRCDATVRYALMHTSGQYVEIEAAGSALGTDKMTTSAATACHKLALRQVLMLATGADNEKPPSGDDTRPKPQPTGPTSAQTDLADSLYDDMARAIDGEDVKAFKAKWSDAATAHKAGLITDAQFAKIIDLKDKGKKVLKI